MAATNAPTTAIGGTVAPYGGSIGYGAPSDFLEHIPAVTWPESVATYNRMRTDPACASILAAYVGPLMAADWRINPAGADPAIVAICSDSLGIPILGEKAAAAGAVRRRGVKWVEHIRLACLHLLWGHMCVDEETEALTQRGWLRGSELREGDELLTLNPETGLSEWHPCEKVNRYPGRHLVRRLEGRSHSSVTTLNHNWITRHNDTGRLGFKKTSELNSKDTFITAARCATLPTVAKYEDAFVELVGWIHAEGNYSATGKHFSLWQSEGVNPAYVATIRRVLSDLFGGPSAGMRRGHGPVGQPKYIEYLPPGKNVWCWRMNRAASDPIADIFLDPSRKIIDPAFLASLTEAQLHLFLDSAMNGDGHVRPNGGQLYGQKYVDRLDSISMACALLGISTTTYQMNADFWQMSLRSRNSTRPVATAARADNRRSVDLLEEYEGTVWCPTVPNRTWLARRRGTVFYTGNSFEPVYEIRDGKAYLRALPERMPSTIVDIKVTDDGELKSIVQEGSGKGSLPNGVEIPADRLLWYCHSREGSNYVGRSLLRSCYSDWTLKIDGKRANAVGINRFGAGTPVAEALPGTNPTPAQIAEAQRMVSAIRVGETGGAVPAGFKIRIIGVEGSLPDIVPTIRMYNEEMRAGALTSVLDLGSTAHGSRALGDTFSDLLKGAIQAVGDYMGEVATQLCERLTTFNAGEDAVPPQVTCGDVGASKAAIVTAITGLVAAGIVTADEGLESYARDGYHLPPKDAVEAPAEPEAAPAPADVTLAASGWQPRVMAAGGADAHTGSEAKLVEWYVHGEGAARIRWNTPGDFDRCRAIAGKHMPPGETAGFCANRHKEATGQWPGKGRVHAADPAQNPPRAGYREPTPAEQAAGIDPQQVDEAQDGLVAEGMALFAAIVAVWGAALAAQITASLAAGSLAGLARLRVDSTDAAQGLAVLMREAADAGVNQVFDELHRAMVSQAPWNGPGSRPHRGAIQVDEAALDDAAAAAADLMGQGLASAAGREAARIAGPDSDPKTIARTAVATVTESDTPIHDAIQAGVTRAMGAGRAAAQAALMVGADLVPFASAIRDINSCGPCLENDGHEYPDLASALRDFPTGHYSACLGRSRCRCLIHLRPVTS